MYIVIFWRFQSRLITAKKGRRMRGAPSLLAGEIAQPIPIF
jgi:hypothetical protein